MTHDLRYRTCHDRCRTCHDRWAQSGGLCRTCAREAGDHRTTIERERDRLARQRARLAAAAHVAPPRELPGITVVVDGVEYDVVWNGAIAR